MVGFPKSAIKETDVGSQRKLTGAKFTRLLPSKNVTAADEAPRQCGLCMCKVAVHFHLILHQPEKSAVFETP